MNAYSCEYILGNTYSNSSFKLSNLVAYEMNLY